MRESERGGQSGEGPQLLTQKISPFVDNKRSDYFGVCGLRAYFMALVCGEEKPFSPRAV